MSEDNWFKRHKVWTAIIAILIFLYLFNIIVEYKVDKIYEEAGVPRPVSGGDSDCSYNKYNCGNFNTYSQAKAMFDKCGGIGNDVHHLDGDNDGIPCESLK